MAMNDATLLAESSVGMHVAILAELSPTATSLAGRAGSMCCGSPGAPDWWLHSDTAGAARATASDHHKTFSACAVTRRRRVVRRVVTLTDGGKCEIRNGYTRRPAATAAAVSPQISPLSETCTLSWAAKLVGRLHVGTETSMIS